MGASETKAETPFCKLLQEYRKRSGLKQAVLAREAGVSSVLISYYETGLRQPRPGTVAKIAKALRLADEDKDKLLSSLKNPGATPDAGDLLDELYKVFNSSRISNELRDKLALQVKGVLMAWKRVQEKTLRWAVIPVAGWQADFLATKATVRLVRRALAETQKSGLDHAVVVVAPNQEEYVGRELSGLRGERKLRVTVQTEPLGLGHAILTVRNHLPENEPFAVILPDDGIEASCLASMVEIYTEHKCSVLAVRKLKKWDEESHGLVFVRERKGRVYRIGSLEEKPESRPSASSMAILGRYVLTRRFSSY